MKWYNVEKGYGYITQDWPPRKPARWWRRQQEPEDIFVHYSEVQMSGYKVLKEGQRVSFDVEYGPKGPQAKYVEPLG
ncbi:cold shock domain-containing protein [Streptomyces sp. NE06-03E]|uniref:cold-shock protein n=1 Tax=Streptomyces sp. NE06-03E TaxID=3028695 RepID=UPI0029BECE69|nr:cold shock domain-containing protein [Streptomyces sp. NE06-03E]MDX3054587.1 cold shock domain-containing protein [Streptomyces sp. NE06-03E]